MSADQQNVPYALEMSSTELERLVGNAQLQAPNVIDGFRRIGFPAGSKVVDVGCGPMGALLVLSELVGPQGTVVGLDMDETSLKHARSILDQRGQSNVHLVRANVNEMQTSAVCPPGPFHAAYCRLFLVWQRNPAATLHRIASILRPGGYIVAHEPLFASPVPKSQPEVPGFDMIFRWLFQMQQSIGASPDVARHYHALCQEAGMIEVSQRGFFNSGATGARASMALRLLQETLRSSRAAIVKHGIASEEQVDGVLRQVMESETWDFQALFGLPYVELIARVP